MYFFTSSHGYDNFQHFCNFGYDALMGVLLLAGGNIDAFTENVEKEVKIHVSIDSLTKDEQIEKLRKRNFIFPQVKQVVFSSSER